jgi:hypothetical protein
MLPAGPKSGIRNTRRLFSHYRLSRPFVAKSPGTSAVRHIRSEDRRGESDHPCSPSITSRIGAWPDSVSRLYRGSFPARCPAQPGLPSNAAAFPNPLRTFGARAAAGCLRAPLAGFERRSVEFYRRHSAIFFSTIKRRACATAASRRFRD